MIMKKTNMKITKEVFDVLWLSLLDNIEKEYSKDHYEGLRVAGIDFVSPY